MRKCKIIKEIYEKNNEHEYKNLVVYTKGFKAIGEYIEEKNYTNLITIKKARIFSYATNCECETNVPLCEIEWLNIFSEEIIAFSFVE